MGVLAATVQQDDFRLAATPDERADPLLCTNCYRASLDLRPAVPGDPFVLGVLLEHAEFVVVRRFFVVHRDVPPRSSRLDRQQLPDLCRDRNRPATYGPNFDTGNIIIHYVGGGRSAG